MKEIFDNKQQKIEFCDLKQVFVRVNEEVVKVNEPIQVSEDEYEDNYVDKYMYDVVLTTVKQPTEANVVSKMKELKIAEVEAYDKSANVNSFTFQGVDMWLDKETRNGLIMRLNAEKAAGKTETTLWLGTQSFTLGVDNGIELLYGLELYASECFDNTSKHLAAVEALGDVEEIFNYDFKVGYPSKIVVE